MLILAVDTAGPNCAACIYDADKGLCLSSISEEIGRGHAEVLPSIVERALTKADIAFSDLGLLAVSEGPGSFAGIRVGISFVRALALGLKIPSIGVSSLIAMAYDVCQKTKQKTLAAIDARRGEVYLSVLDNNGSVIIAPSKYILKDANVLISTHTFSLCGNGIGVLGVDDRQIIHQNASPPIDIIAVLAAKTMGASDGQITAPKPQYLRAADAKKQAGFVLDRV